MALRNIVVRLANRLRGGCQRSSRQVRYVGEWHSHPPQAAAQPSPVDARQIDWLAALMGMDSMPALMVIAGDEGLAVILANERAEQVPHEQTP